MGWISWLWTFTGAAKPAPALCMTWLPVVRRSTATIAIRRSIAAAPLRRTTTRAILRRTASSSVARRTVVTTPSCPC